MYRSNQSCSSCFALFIFSIGVTLAHTDDFNYAPVKDFKIVGKERYLPYDEFDGFPPTENCSHMKKLNLSFVQFDPNILIGNLRKCKNLTSLILENVEWTRPITVKKVDLPALEKFRLVMYKIKADSGSELMAHLFFSQTAAPGGVTIQLRSIVNGQQLYFYPSEKHLYLKLFDYDLTNYFNFEKLTLEQTEVNLRNVRLNLTELSIIGDLSSFGPEIFEFIKSLRRLSSLVMKYFSMEDESLPVSVDLSNIRDIQNIEKLEFVNMQIWSSEFMELKHLTGIKMTKCEVNLTLISVSNLNSDAATSMYLRLDNTVIIGETLNTLVSKNKLSLLTIDYRRIPNSKFDLNSLVHSSDTLFTCHLYGLELDMPSTSFQVSFMYALSHFTECQFNGPLLQNRGQQGALPGFAFLGIIRCKISFVLFQEILNSSSLIGLEFVRSDDEIPEINKFFLDSGIPEYAFRSELERSNETVTGWKHVRSQPLETKFNTGLRDKALYAYIVILCIIIGIGVTGNILSMLVLTQKNMRSSTSCILLGLAFCDTLVLITYACSVLNFGVKLILVFLKFRMSMDTEVYRIFGYSITKSSVTWLDEFYYCFLYPLNKTAYTGSVYITVALTVERYIAVSWPLHSRRFLRPKLAIYTVLSVLIFASLLNFSRWVEAHQYISEIDLESYYDWDGVQRKSLVFIRSTVESGLLRYRYYRLYYHGLIWLSFMFILPISALTMFNFKILKRLRTSRRDRTAMASGQRTNRNEADATGDQSLTKMLLCVIMIFLICNSTSGVIIWCFMEYGGKDPSDIEIFSCIPLIINSSVNFIIYMLFGSRFRNEFCRLIAVWKRRFRRIVGRDPDDESRRRAVPLTSFTS